MNTNMTWTDILEAEFAEPYFKEISSYIKHAYAHEIIYPPKTDVFTAFRLTPYDNIKIVILGQDPYHQLNQAHGLAFSVNQGVKIPPSLQNIYKEIRSDLNIEPPNHGCLTSWAAQGVLLLNTALTVREGEPGCHAKVWEPFTKRIIKRVNERTKPVVWLLWGGFARSKRYLITNELHSVIETTHPSPLSAYNGFFGSKPFSQANAFLTLHGIEPIDWSIKNI